jgi:virulence factor
MEKPPGVYTEQTRQLGSAAARGGCLTMVGFQRRFVPIAVECRRRVLERGPVYQIVTSFLKWYDGGPIYGGSTDLLYSDTIHIVDTIRWLAGSEPVDVYSDVKAHGTEYASAHNAFIRFANGVVGYLQSNHRVGARQLRFEIHGRGISCLVAPEEEASIYADGSPAGRLDAAELAGGPEMFRMGFEQESRHFVDCIRDGRQPDTNLADALRTMQLCDAIHRSSPPWTGDS